MATKKDLVEAHSFSRRRLVTAFLSGAPGGREVEPSRPGRTVVGGLALAVLLVAAAAIGSVLAPRTEEDWNRVGLVVSRQEAAPYVIVEESTNPELIPVINITSAQLILGADAEPTYVDQEVIDDQTPGEPIGIAGAPQTLPRPRQFIESGWTACTDDGLGIAVDVSAQARVTVPARGGVLVQSGGAFYVIARSGELDLDQRRARRYLLPDGPLDDLLARALGLEGKADARAVPLEWVDLFPPGGELGLATFGVGGFGQPLDDPALPSGAKVGDYFLDPSGTSGVYLTADGRAAPLDDFALAVYANSSRLGDPEVAPTRLDGDPPVVPSARRSYADAHWPDTTLDEVRGQVCARLDARHEDVPLVDLGVDPDDSAVADEDVAPGQRSVTLDRGRGAFVRAGSWDQTTSTSAWVIDPRGEAHALLGGDTVERLGYADTNETFVPDAWLELFAEGVELSLSRALCPPDPSPPDPSRAGSTGCQQVVP